MFPRKCFFEPVDKYRRCFLPKPSRFFLGRCLCTADSQDDTIGSPQYLQANREQSYQEGSLILTAGLSALFEQRILTVVQPPGLVLAWESSGDVAPHWRALGSLKVVSGDCVPAPFREWLAREP
jgi:hypothetical protein